MQEHTILQHQPTIHAHVSFISNLHLHTTVHVGTYSVGLVLFLQERAK